MTIGNESVMPSFQPVWDPKRRELRLGDVLVKRYQWPAPNQEKILVAFSEQEWPRRIDDPLPASDVNAKSKLHDTIKHLNRNQQKELIKFRGDGTGRGILLEIVSEEEAARRAEKKRLEKLERDRKRAANRKAELERKRLEAEKQQKAELANGLKSKEGSSQASPKELPTT